jgi:hypothetical protein
MPMIKSPKVPMIVTTVPMIVTTSFVNDQSSSLSVRQSVISDMKCCIPMRFGGARRRQVRWPGRQAGLRSAGKGRQARNSGRRAAGWGWPCGRSERAGGGDWGLVNPTGSPAPVTPFSQVAMGFRRLEPEAKPNNQHPRPRSGLDRDATHSTSVRWVPLRCTQTYGRAAAASSRLLAHPGCFR